MAGADVVFQLRGAAKRYGSLTALAPTDLEVERGSTLVLLGPSGCGKSTLVRLLIGLIRPDEGEVRFCGEPLTPEQIAALRRRTGFVVQGGGLFPHMTALENVTVMARHLRWDGPRITARISELLEVTRFPADALDRYPALLSGGQAQRVSLMRALMLDPEALLLDEPLGALDPITRSDLQTDLKEIFARLRKTVVLVTHDLGEAAYLSDRIALMREGRILQAAPYKELVDAPVDPFVTRFIHAQQARG